MKMIFINLILLVCAQVASGTVFDLRSIGIPLDGSAEVQCSWLSGRNVPEPDPEQTCSYEKVPCKIERADHTLNGEFTIRCPGRERHCPLLEKCLTGDLSPTQSEVVRRRYDPDPSNQAHDGFGIGDPGGTATAPVRRVPELIEPPGKVPGSRASKRAGQ